LGVQVGGQQFNGVAHGSDLKPMSASGRTWGCGH
jgi:hypothetical protein